MTLHHCLVLSALVFSLGVFGLLRQRNIISLLIAIELMLNAVMINFVSFAYFKSQDPTAGSVFAIFVIALTSAEMAVALAVVVSLFRHQHNLDIQGMEHLNG